MAGVASRVKFFLDTFERRPIRYGFDTPSNQARAGLGAGLRVNTELTRAGGGGAWWRPAR